MPTLKLKLIGPMQSWGTRSRFEERDTDLEPSKSGVLGLMCAALGVDRSDWDGLKPLCNLRMGVRIDEKGILRTEYHTAQSMDHSGKVLGTTVTRRHYLADAAFLVGLESPDADLLWFIQRALKNPRWPLALGRKAFVPAEPIYFRDPEAITDAPLEESLQQAPYLGRDEEAEQLNLRFVVEQAALDPSRRRMTARKLDQPTAAFSERKFGNRVVEIYTLPIEVNRVLL